ncbi:MAG: pyruvate dehydrogenase E2 component (dihydrolipoamide acetyltransferase), partial [Lentisphaeria bacterium]
AAPAQAAAPQAAAAASTSTMDVTVPDIGGSEGVDVIEVCVAEGDEVKEGDSIVVLESDKASMEVPAPASGKVLKLLIKEGDKASLGTPVLTLQVNGGAQVETSAAPAPVASSAPSAPAPAKRQTSSEAYSHVTQSVGSDVYAGPAVRKLARELGVELVGVKGTGPRGRMSKDDLKAHVKMLMQKKPTTAAVTGGSGIPAIPAVDFSKFGEVEIVKMSKIHKITAANMSRNWLNVPHVTQFDDADITDLEEFRKGMKAEAEKAGIKLTPLPFLLKACAAALKYEPTFNASMHADGEHIVKKKYINIGIAVATPNGLMVPVIKDVDKKGLYQLAQDSNALAKKARDGKLLPKEMQGGCFTISSLGPIGGTGFTPIVNAPEVAILGVSKAAIKPVWNGKEFVPRQLLPLCLSYDHRAINGADAGRFFTYLNAVISDVRKLIL